MIGTTCNSLVAMLQSEPLDTEVVLQNVTVVEVLVKHLSEL